MFKGSWAKRCTPNYVKGVTLALVVWMCVNGWILAFVQYCLVVHHLSQPHRQAVKSLKYKYTYPHRCTTVEEAVTLTQMKKTCKTASTFFGIHDIDIWRLEKNYLTWLLYLIVWPNCLSSLPIVPDFFLYSRLWWYLYQSILLLYQCLKIHSWYTKYKSNINS